jgi:hypothetical protein
MEHADHITSTIDAYLETNELSEEELSVFMQLDFDDDNNDFRIDYTLTSHEDESAMNIDTGFWYDTLPEAWENYLDQIGEVNQNYPTANIEHPNPEEYKGGKIGGNPVMSIPDAESEI